jgi:hypothetical protein
VLSSDERPFLGFVRDATPELKIMQKQLKQFDEA